MALFDAPAREVQHHARRTVHQASPAVQRLARLGYAAKGVVYLIIGFIAAQAALSRGEQVEGSEGAMATILRQPFGKVLLGITALGLAGYVLWRVVQALMDPEGKGGGARGSARASATASAPFCTRGSRWRRCGCCAAPAGAGEAAPSTGAPW